MKDFVEKSSEAESVLIKLRQRQSKFNEDFDGGTDQFYCNICDIFCSEKETLVKHMYLFHK